ncbi:hypothetical protein C7447_101958 [Tenacibaculum adriaticum]|uniref:Uncharacterized protein n=1 Tax=Tenacibaculum adriaticum TaxID=413713 RepID=A0A5S5DWY2_9FLAO|nr:hypothetical protein [Tenacibaculum adriaticum]TYQ00346.1 hypothetical protein C7447_101958 [Tenacibaculum adriaticum]
MKKQILNLGKALNKAEQKQINGGFNVIRCHGHHDCPSGWLCDYRNRCNEPQQPQ